MAATRYILLNPVKAKIIENPWDYTWSSAKHHMGMATNALVKDTLLRGLVNNWKEFLTEISDKDDIRLLQLHERTGRPLGNNVFIKKLESILSIDLQKKKVGRKKTEK